ncbi:flavodoxin domain-containing protein [Amycolatopsis benzoatilytica]|uniref:flavodoxin domain-containing protein n=1 Tax=Amycolatopsis benzoatilytica TaxID=346045 RepID=UPI0003723AB0|nr:flavodoxin domain-containing protein [Amycolatopsis benzoatilytica]
MKIVIAVATRHGSTREIAEQIAASLRAGLEEAGTSAEVDVADAAHVESFAGCDAAVIGSAVYFGHWLDPARQLVREHREELSRIPVWLFSSGPVGQRTRPGEDPVDATDVLACCAAREHRLFGGKIDRSVLHFPERAVVAALRAKDGDNRDWPVIRAWGQAIARQLSDARRGPSSLGFGQSGSGATAAARGLLKARPRSRREERA